MNDTQILSQNVMLKELLAWSNSFIEQSASWRRNSFEEQWRRWQRNSDAIFDPAISAGKEPWQSRAFVPLTPSHRETIQAQLFKTIVGPRPPLEVKARPSVNPQFDQSQNIKDLIAREMEKSRFEVNFNGVLEDATTYGSGFCRIRWEDQTDDRKTKQPVFEPVSIFDPTSLLRSMSGQRRVIGYQDVIQEEVIYRGTVIEHISIWDIFPDPKALTIKGHAIGYRYDTTYGEIVKGAQEGYYLESAVNALKDIASDEQSPMDKRTVESDRRIDDSQIQRTDYQKILRCYEIQARLPKKWVLINGEDIDDPEKLIPAIVRFHKTAVVSVALNTTHDGEPNIYKCDYIPVALQFYGRGVPEMLKDVQLVSNEEVNQRLDAKSLTINPMSAVIEKAVLYPDKDLVSKPGGYVRLNANTFGGQPFSTDSVLRKMEMGDLPQAAFIEAQEWERWAKERTSANSATLASRGPGSDANETLGGMELLRDQANSKFAYIGMLMEFDFLYQVFRAYWKRIYENLDPQILVQALGEQRAATFQLMSPEQIDSDYQYIPQGIYEMENKLQRQAVLASIRQQFAGAPWLNDLAFFKKELQSANEDPSLYTFPEAEAVQIQFKAQLMAQQMAPQMAQQIAGPLAEKMAAHMRSQEKRYGDSKAQEGNKEPAVAGAGNA